MSEGQLAELSARAQREQIQISEAIRRCIDERMLPLLPNDPERAALYNVFVAYDTRAMSSGSATDREIADVLQVLWSGNASRPLARLARKFVPRRLRRDTQRDEVASALKHQVFHAAVSEGAAARFLVENARATADDRKRMQQKELGRESATLVVIWLRAFGAGLGLRIGSLTDEQILTPLVPMMQTLLHTSRRNRLADDDEKRASKIARRLCLMLGIDDPSRIKFAPVAEGKSIQERIEQHDMSWVRTPRRAPPTPDGRAQEKSPSK